MGTQGMHKGQAWAHNGFIQGYKGCIRVKHGYIMGA